MTAFSFLRKRGYALNVGRWLISMETKIKLSAPIICDCGFSTMDFANAIRHIKDKHPDIAEADDNEGREIAENIRDYWTHLRCGAD